MKREDFMKYAEREIENAFRGQRNRMMNLVEQAWAEGKRNAEIDGVADIVTGVLARMNENGSNTIPNLPYKSPLAYVDWTKQESITTSTYKDET